MPVTQSLFRVLVSSSYCRAVRFASVAGNVPLKPAIAVRSRGSNCCDTSRYHRLVSSCNVDGNVDDNRFPLTSRYCRVDQAEQLDGNAPVRLFDATLKNLHESEYNRHNKCRPSRPRATTSHGRCCHSNGCERQEQIVRQQANLVTTLCCRQFTSIAVPNVLKRQHRTDGCRKHGVRSAFRQGRHIKVHQLRQRRPRVGNRAPKLVALNSQVRKRCERGHRLRHRADQSTTAQLQFPARK